MWISQFRSNFRNLLVEKSESFDNRLKDMLAVVVSGQKSFAFGCDGDLIEIDSLDHRGSENSSTNGSADNHETELEDKFVFDGSTLNNNNKASDPSDCRSKSTKSKFTKEKRLSKQKSIDDTARDLSSPNNSSPSIEPYSSGNTSHQFEDVDRDNSNDDERMSNNRRSSCDSDGVKKTPWARLSRETGRRYSDGSLRQGSDLFHRRKSLKRQSRITDNEAVQYCEPDSLSGLVMLEQTEATQPNENLQENPTISETSSFGENESDDRIKRSDRLSQTDVEKESEAAIENLPTIAQIPPEINGRPNSNEEKVESTTTKKAGKKRHGLSSLLGLYNSVVSVRTEPGF